MMKNATALSILLSIYLISGMSCHFTSTVSKVPSFSIRIDSLSQRLDSLVTCQHINIKGTQNTTDGQTTEEIEVDLTNPTLPSFDEDNLRSIAKRVSTEVRRDLANPNEYSIFKVFFVDQSEKKGVNVKTSTGFTFKKEEL
jgi:hypothetical protein